MPKRILRGIPDFELRMPDNPCLEQGELFKFVVLDTSHIGLYCQKIPEHWMVKILVQEDLDDDRKAGAKKFRSFMKQLDFSETPEFMVANYENFKRLLEKHGRKRPYSVNFHDWEDEFFYHYGFPSKHLPLIDRLALGDVRAGEELREIEERNGH